MSATKRFRPAPTVEQIQTDVLTKLSNDYWAPYSDRPRQAYSAKVVEDVYKRELIGTNFAVHRVMLLEFSQYLENYLWPNYSVDATDAHVLSIVVMVNEKFRERVPAWECFKSSPDKFPTFFRHLMMMSLREEGLSFKEQTILIVFLIHCFNSHGVDLINDQTKRLVSLGIWINLLPSRREQMLAQSESNVYRRYWRAIIKNDSKLDEASQQKVQLERTFLAKHVQKYFHVLDSIAEKGAMSEDKLRYCERFIELLIDLQSQLLTRRFFNTVLDDSHAIVRSRLSALSDRQDDADSAGGSGRLFRQLLDVLSFYATFEINDETGEARTDSEMTAIHYDEITSLQKAVFKHFPELQKFALTNVASIDTRDSLLKHFKPLTLDSITPSSLFACS